MPGKQFDPKRATMQEAIEHFAPAAPYMREARNQAELNEMIDGYQAMLGGSRNKGMRAEMLAYLAAQGITENQAKQSQDESRSSYEIASQRMRMGWLNRLRFKLLDIFRRD